MFIYLMLVLKSEIMKIKIRIDTFTHQRHLKNDHLIAGLKTCSSIRVM